MMPTLNNIDRAARDLMDRKVQAREIAQYEADNVMAVGVLIARRQIAQWRRDRISEEFLTTKFGEMEARAQLKLDNATNPIAEHSARLDLASAELYAAVWEGMQKDLAEYLAATA